MSRTGDRQLKVLARCDEAKRRQAEAIAIEHGHPGEPCEYIGNDMWDCGHMDNRPWATEKDERRT